MTTIEGTATYGRSHFGETPDVTLTHDVVELTSDQAPVAATVPDGFTFKSLESGHRAEVRIHDGNFYRQQLDSPWRSPLTPEFPFLAVHMNTFYGHHDTEHQARSAVKAGLAGIVLIDGAFWLRVEEPVLYVGINGVSIDVRANNSLLVPARTFALTEADAAVEAARFLREEDAMVRSSWRPSALDPGVEVLIPSAFKLARNRVRMSFAQDEAEADARRAIALLGSVDARSLHEAGTLLLAAAARLDSKTHKAY